MTLEECFTKFDYLMSIHFPGIAVTEHFKNNSLSVFYGKIRPDVIEKSLEIAHNKLPDNPDECIKYFCGICWGKIRATNGNLNTEAQELVAYWRRISYLSPARMMELLKCFAIEEIKELFDHFTEQTNFAIEQEIYLKQQEENSN